MPWKVEFHDAFAEEVAALEETVQDELFAAVELLRRFGPALRRPYADTLNASRHANMKELRFAADRQVWRVAFAFDPERDAILLCGGSKSGVNQRRFYATLISVADRRFDEHLADLRRKQR